MSSLKEKYSSVKWTGLKRLEATRDTTQAQMEREMFSSAKANGKQHVSRAAGGRQPTEVFRNGEWIKVMNTD